MENKKLWIKNLIESNGVVVAAQKIVDCIKTEKIGIAEIGLRRLYEGFLGHEMGFDDRNIKFLTEDAISGDVRLSAFSNIVGVLLGNEIIKAYDSFPKIGDQLVTEYNTRLKDERLPGFTAVKEEVDQVKEGEEYPSVGFGEKYITTGEAIKRGEIISVTEEAIYYDQTGMLQEFCREIGKRIAERKEKTILRAVLGVDTCYHPNGVPTALYGGAPYLVASNALVDWTDLENAEVTGLGAMTDEAGVPIGSTPMRQLLVPLALNRTARRIINATEIIHGDFDNAASVKTMSANPYGGENIQVLTSALMHGIVGDSTTWFCGDFKQQFRWKNVWPIQAIPAPVNNLKEFTADIKFAYKVRYLGNVFARDNKYVVKCTA